MSWSDAAAAAHDAELEGAALAEAQAAAEATAATFTDEWADNALRPDVSVDLDIGGDDQPLFVFTMNVEVADDLDADEYPLDEIQQLASALRSTIAASSVDEWAWLVTAGSKARAAH